VSNRIIFMAAVAVLIGAGCVAPMSHNLTGRSLEQRALGIDAGAVFISDESAEGFLPAVKVAYGISRDFDIGLQFDFLSTGFYGRKSFVNREEGLSFAGVAGLGLAAGGFYAYTGPVVSIRAGAFEPYFGPRLNLVIYGDNDSSSSIINWKEGSFVYPQATLGFCLWASGRVGCNGEVTYLIGETGLDDAVLTGMAGLMLRL
jgi:hypothetical protein